MRNKNIPLLSLGILALLTSCDISYSKPITQEAARNIISNTDTAIREKDYASFSRINFVSKLSENRITSFIGREKYVEETYEFSFEKDPYKLTIKGIFNNKEDKDNKRDDFELTITKDASTYYVSYNGGEEKDINSDEYKVLWKFCDFPTYIKNTSQRLTSKALNLIESVGFETDKKDNKLTGFQTSSKSSDDLKIDFTGREFAAKEIFFQEDYNADTSTELSMYMNGGLIQEFSTNYSFTIQETAPSQSSSKDSLSNNEDSSSSYSSEEVASSEETNPLESFYDLGTYEGQIYNYLTYSN